MDNQAFCAKCGWIGIATEPPRSTTAGTETQRRCPNCGWTWTECEPPSYQIEAEERIKLRLNGGQ